jgi:DNA-binding response OmpR family regulator
MVSLTSVMGTDMRTLLVIEDHVPTLDTLCIILNANGYRALPAQNAEQAKRKFRNNPIDMLVLDHGLPGISGSEIATQLKLVRPVLVLMLSGNPELTEIPKDVDVLLAKPQPVASLLTAIQQLFDR